MKKIIQLFFLFFLSIGNAQIGTLDLTFNPSDSGYQNGIIGSSVAKVALQSDGKIIIAGLFTSFKDVARNHIARLNPDGSLDLTFNPGTGNTLGIEQLALQPDGKIIIGGSFTTIGKDDFEETPTQR